MARSANKRGGIRCPSLARQIAFHQLLTGARKTWLAGALAEALATIDPNVLRDQLSGFVPVEASKLLATAGIRDERVFPVPILLETKPTLIGYYRLLAGAPQKSFYAGDTGMARFKSMESAGLLTTRQREGLPDFCRAMCEALGGLVMQISPQIRAEDVAELPLLTLGAQLQGANNNLIGQAATKNVFLVIGELVEQMVSARTDSRLELANSSGNRVVVSLSGDPDVKIQVQQGDQMVNKLAIEIKGGTDRSNVHNRAGEAEKSHLKAKKQDFREFWTLISMKGIDSNMLRHESQTTNSWFDIAQILARQGADWDQFRNRLADVVGIRLASRVKLKRK